MKKAILLSLLFSFAFIGCASKKEPQVIFKEKIVCVEQQTISKPVPTQMRIHKDDVPVAMAFKQTIDSSFEFYENQVNRNNQFCKGVSK